MSWRASPGWSSPTVLTDLTDLTDLSDLTDLTDLTDLSELADLTDPIGPSGPAVAQCVKYGARAFDRPKMTAVRDNCADARRQ